MRRLIGAALLTLALVGCSGIPVKYVRPYHDLVGRGYTRYVAKDGLLTPDEKRARLQAVETMERVLQEAER